MVKKIAEKKGEYKQRSIPEGKAQVNFNMPMPLLEKLRTIAHSHGMDNTEVYILAAERFVEQYEKKNGPIKVEQKRKEIKL